jgi:hypothetical protein
MRVAMSVTDRPVLETRCATGFISYASVVLIEIPLEPESVYLTVSAVLTYALAYTGDVILTAATAAAAAAASNRIGFVYNAPRLIKISI